MSEKIDISVIVVTYNQEKTIGRTLDSILAQHTDASYEIVIGDDCSTDGTVAVCREYARRLPDRIVLVERQENLGVVRNYFDCIDRSRGRYLADCAGDDFWVDPLKLQKQWEIIKSNPECSIVFTDWLGCDTDASNVRRMDDTLPHSYHWRVSDSETLRARPDLYGRFLAGEVKLHLCTALYDKQILVRRLSRDRDMFVSPDYSCEDQQIIMAMLSDGVAVYIPEVTLHYTVGHESISHQKDFGRRARYSLRATRQTIRLQKYFGVSDSEMAGFYRRQLPYLASLVFNSGESELRDDFHRLVKENGLRLPLKAKVFDWFTSFGPLWHFVKWPYNLLHRH